MTHPRTTIREYMKTAMVNAAIASLPAAKIFTNRSLPRHVEDLPAATIVTLPEESSTAETCSAQLRRELSVAIEITVKTADNDAVDTDLDNLSETIEAVFAVDSTLGGNALDCTLTGTTFDSNDIDGEYTVGKLRLTFNVTYFA